MTSARDIPEMIQWHEGMLLAPQHFQQQALRHDQFSLYHMAMAAPFHWGLVRLNIDEAALVSGVFRVLEMEAILPDGLVVRAPVDDSDEQLELDITALADTVGEAPLTIHITVPAAKAGGIAAPGDLARFRVVEGPEVADATSGEGEIRIPRLRPRLGLAVTSSPGQRPPQKYVSFPVARVVYRNEAFVLSDYAPPVLQVGTHSPVGRLCSDMCRRIREKALYLADRAGVISGSSTHPLVQESTAEIRSLVTGLPPLEAMLSTGVCHPFSLYLALCNMVGHMAAFSTGGAPPLLPRYDHDDCMIAFNEARYYVDRMLDRVKETLVGIPFHLEDNKFTLELQERMTDVPRLILGVRAPASMSAADIAEWLDRSLIASRRRIDMLWDMRVGGAARRVVEPEDKVGITPSRGTVLFTVENDPQYIVPGDVLEIWNPDNRSSRHKPSEVTLYVQAEDKTDA